VQRVAQFQWQIGERSPEEHHLRQLLEALKSDIDEARKSVELFDKLENGKKKNQIAYKEE